MAPAHCFICSVVSFGRVGSARAKHCLLALVWRCVATRVLTVPFATLVHADMATGNGVALWTRSEGVSPTCSARPGVDVTTRGVPKLTETNGYSLAIWRRRMTHEISTPGRIYALRW